MRGTPTSPTPPQRPYPRWLYHSGLRGVRGPPRRGTSPHYAHTIVRSAFIRPTQAKYIWPARWSTVKVLYVLNRYGNLAFLGACTLQTLGIWRSTADEVSRIYILSLSFQPQYMSVLLQLDARPVAHPVRVIRVGARYVTSECTRRVHHGTFLSGCQCSCCYGRGRRGDGMSKFSLSWLRSSSSMRPPASPFSRGESCPSAVSARCMRVVPSPRLIYIRVDDAYPFSFVVGTCIEYIPCAYHAPYPFCEDCADLFLPCSFLRESLLGAGCYAMCLTANLQWILWIPRCAWCIVKYLPRSVCSYIYFTVLY